VSLVLDHVNLRLGSRVLIDNLSATLGPGEVLAVMGPSGSGKSSLLAWLCGTLPPALQAQGRACLNGREIHTVPLARRRVGILFQDDLLFPHLTALENLLFALPPGRRAEREARAQAALARAELAGLGDRRPHQLSGGQRSRVAVLRALLAQPEALLLDEPFSRLDVALRARFRAFVFAQAREAGIPTVLVTHDAADVPEGARVLTLHPTQEPDDA
jgi:putative thiamine transport system ATP-binding protein